MSEVEVEISPNDIRIDVFRAGGPGGQSVNTTNSAVRLTHIPTGLVVSCQDEKSQLQNRAACAADFCRARLYAMELDRQVEAQSEARRSQVGSGERSEKVRTYNFPQNRVTDHRVGLTLHRLDAVLEGDLDELIEALITSEQAEKMARLGEQMESNTLVSSSVWFDGRQPGQKDLARAMRHETLVGIRPAG